MAEQHNNLRFPTANGYMTEVIRSKYIKASVAKGLLPKDAHRMANIISLDAPSDTAVAIQFWQLFSVLGQDRIVKLVANFYQRVFNDDQWFTEVFARVGGLNHHVNTQSSMWIDVMGGGLAYHGGEYRLSFHHTHNAMLLMNTRGAQRWVKLMNQTLEDPTIDLTSDPRVLTSIRTFLSHFLGNYASEFKFEMLDAFAPTNPSISRRINFLKMSDADIEALSIDELRAGLEARGVDVGGQYEKEDLVNTAKRL